MPVTIELTPHYVKFVPQDFISPSEIIEAVDTFWGSHSTCHSLWDASNSSLSNISYERFHEITAASLKYAEKRGPNAKTAVLVRNDTDLLLVQALLGYAPPQAPIKYAAFTAFEEAEAWLLGD